MALIDCKECGNRISDKSDVCIKCGCPINEKEEKLISNRAFKFRWVIYILILFVGLNIYSSLTKDNSVINLLPNTLYDEDVQIQEDQYKAFPITLKNSGEISIEYNIFSGTNIDVYFLEASQYRKWENSMRSLLGEEFYFNSDLSTFGLSSSSKTQKVAKGTYYIVLDNTDFGATSPPMNLYNDISSLHLLVQVK